MTTNAEPTARSWSPRTREGALALALGLLTLIALGWLSVLTQPAALVSAAWWPASGIAVGLGARVSRRYAWLLALAASLVTIPLAVWSGNPLPLAALYSLTVGIELFVGTLILRGRQDRVPRLRTPADIGRVLVAVAAAAAAFAVLAALIDLARGDAPAAWDRIATGFTKHAAGILLIAPLFMDIPRGKRAGRTESVAAAVSTLGVAASVFILNPTLPLAFLPFVPLVWVAVRSQVWSLLTQILVISVIASYGSASGWGPFSFERLGPTVGTIMLQTFEIAIVIVFLALSLAVGAERALTSRLRESELVFRRNFETSVAGMVIVSMREGGVVEQSNSSGRAMFPALARAGVAISEVVGTDATVRFAAELEALEGENRRFSLPVAGDRVMDVSVSPIGESDGHPRFAVQFFDITAALRARELERAELERAAEVQRALTPTTLPPVPGWTFGAVSLPARQVGGDFYDVRLRAMHAALTLGDVMGKGMGAGMLAAATRAAVRSSDPGTGPADAVRRTAEILESDLRQSGAFITMACALVDLVSGDVRLVDAGHGLSFVLRARDGSVERLASDLLPVGVESTWSELTTSLEPGDTILLLSDGVMDLWGEDVDVLYSAICRIVRESAGNVRDMIGALCAGPDDDAASAVERDDITAVALGRERAQAA